MPAVLVHDLRKTYPRAAAPALDGLDLQIPPGTVHGLLGPNGAGKTTAVRILATLLRADGGRAEIDGVDVLRDPRGVRRRIGLVGQGRQRVDHRPRGPRRRGVAGADPRRLRHPVVRRYREMNR